MIKTSKGGKRKLLKSNLLQVGRAQWDGRGRKGKRAGSVKTINGKLVMRVYSTD